MNLPVPLDLLTRSVDHETTDAADDLAHICDDIAATSPETARRFLCYSIVK